MILILTLLISGCNVSEETESGQEVDTKISITQTDKKVESDSVSIELKPTVTTDGLVFNAIYDGYEFTIKNDELVKIGINTYSDIDCMNKIVSYKNHSENKIILDADSENIFYLEPNKSREELNQYYKLVNGQCRTVDNTGNFYKLTKSELPVFLEFDQTIKFKG